MSDEPKIYTVASYKGGVGKTTIASELAYALGAVLVDLDWDRGNVTRAWGYRTEERSNAPLLDAIEAGRTPRPRKGVRKADLIPCHEDFVGMQPAPDAMAALLGRWAKELGRDLVVDTHPGGSPSTLGAMAAAHRIVVPAPFGEKEHEALEGMVQQLADYPLMVIPSRVPPVPPARDIDRLRRITEAASVPVGPPVSHYVWLPRRSRRMAVSAAPVSKQSSPSLTRSPRSPRRCPSEQRPGRPREQAAPGPRDAAAQAPALRADRTRRAVHDRDRPHRRDRGHPGPGRRDASLPARVAILLNRVVAGARSGKDAREGLEAAEFDVLTSQIPRREVYALAYGVVPEVADGDPVALLADEYLTRAGIEVAA